MLTFLAIIGFTACSAVATLAVFKAVETVFFFREFHETVTKSLAKIEERLRNLKP